MNKMEMFQEMAKRIAEDESLAISEWEGNFQFEQGIPVSSSLENVNEIKIPGSPELPEGQMTAIEMLVTSMARCYSTTLHKNAYEKGISLDKVAIHLNCKFDQRPFLGMNEGDPGVIEPKMQLTIESRAERQELEALSLQTLKQSPVLQSLATEIDFTLT